MDTPIRMHVRTPVMQWLSKLKVLLIFCFIQNAYAQRILMKQDRFTSEAAVYEETKTFADGTSMSLDKVDGVMYIKENGTFYRRKVNGEVNVKWFGAKGDGDQNDLGTDDTFAIQNALTVLEKVFPVYDLTGQNLFGGFTLYFPAGKYLVNKTFILPNNCTVTGASYHTTVLHSITPKYIFTNIGGFYDNGVDMIMNSGITIKELTLKQGGISFQQAVGSRIENVRIMNLFGNGTDTGIAIKLSVDLRIKNVKVFRSTGYGILYQETLGGKLSTTTSFENVWVSHCKVGMLVDGSDGKIGIISSSVNNSIFEYNNVGIQFHGKISNFALRDVHFEQNKINALEVDGDVNLVVDNIFGDEVGALEITGSGRSDAANRVYLRNFNIPYKVSDKYKGKVILQN